MDVNQHGNETLLRVVHGIQVHHGRFRWLEGCVCSLNCARLGASTMGPLLHHIHVQTISSKVEKELWNPCTSTTLGCLVEALDSCSMLLLTLPLHDEVSSRDKVTIESWVCK